MKLFLLYQNLDISQKDILSQSDYVRKGMIKKEMV